MKNTTISDRGEGSRLPRFQLSTSEFIKALLPSSLLGGALLAIILLLVFLYATCTQYVQPDEFAVKQVDVNIPGITGERGLQTNILNTGVHLLIPGCEKLIILPKNIRVITMHKSKEKSAKLDSFVRYEDAAHIQTSDGFFINLDVSIIYRVIDPVKVVKEFGAGNLYEQNGIVLQAEPTFKACMGTLNPEDFFDSQKRVAKQDEARNKFNEFLVPRGLKVDYVLIRYPQYHDAVQARIEARNIQEQSRQKNIEETKLALAEADLKEIQKQGEASLLIKLMEGSNYITRLTAQMDSYQRIKYSDANKLTALAEAQKQLLINEAYQGIGADRLVGLEWAKVLSGLETIVLPAGGDNGFNPFDLDRLMKQLQIKRKEGQ